VWAGASQEVPHFSAVDKWSNQLVGATAMWAAQGKLKKKYGIEDERKALFGAIEEWVAEVGEKPFVGGPKPNLGDLAVYACIRAIDGFDAHKDLLANTAIQPWYRRVEQAIGESTCLKAE
jgi:microsomal prostaglandin-E synthase 2